MKAKDYSTTITVDKSPDDVFRAVTNVHGWWSQTIQGSADELGAEFEYRYKNLQRSTQQVTEYMLGRRIIWRVRKAEIAFAKNQFEWTGTRIVFEIGRANGATELHFTHVGLHPRLECFPECSGTWTTYVGHSLLRLITTGRGRPDPRFP
jgi:hypothetical protein